MTVEEVYNRDNDDLVFPYLEGSKGLGNKFGKLNAKRYLNYDYDLQIKISNQFKHELTLLGVKNKKRVTLGDRECYLSPKIFIRQSAKELIASYTEEKYAANNSLYILTNKDYTEKNKELLKYVCALLNSNLLTYYAQKKRIIRMGNGKTPQIKIGDLQKLRINIDEIIFDRLIKLVDNILFQEPISDTYYNIINEINRLVYNSYNMTKEEIEVIEKEIKHILI